MIGIIAAMNEEMQEIKKEMVDVKARKIFNLEFTLGKIEDKECVLVECGIGKVNAARTAQIMIDNFKIDYIVNVGTAGATSKELNATDVVIGENLVQYDFDLTAFGREKGYITGVGKFMEADKGLIEKAKTVIEKLDADNSFKVVVGNIASADMFCTSREVADDVLEEFSALCVEMEGAAIAQICKLDEIPFVVIRSISDSPNGNNDITFDEYLKIASKRGASVLKEMLK